MGSLPNPTYSEAADEFYDWEKHRYRSRENGEEMCEGDYLGAERVKCSVLEQQHVLKQTKQQREHEEMEARRTLP